MYGGQDNGKRRQPCLHGKRPAAFRNLCQIGYSGLFPLATFAFMSFSPSVSLYQKTFPDARSRKASNKREKN